jgi:DNA-binding transcriptional ArsR family regulator
VRQYHHPSEDEITLTKVLAALSDPVRLSIVSALASKGECGWSGFDACVSNSTLSHHMKVLREAGIICNRGDGTRCIVSLRPELERALPGLLKSILSFAEAECPLRPGTALLSGAESDAGDAEPAGGRRARAPS